MDQTNYQFNVIVQRLSEFSLTNVTRNFLDNTLSHYQDNMVICTEITTEQGREVYQS